MAETSEADELRNRLAALEAQNRALVARQAASTEILRLISASPSDPVPVFELIARHARTLCAAESVSVTAYDGAMLHLRAVDGHDPHATAAWTRLYPRVPDKTTVHGRTVLAGAIVHVRDSFGDAGMNPMIRTLGHAESAVGVPLLLNGRVIGTIGLGRSGAGGFDNGEVALVEAFAEQAVIAMGNARLVGELKTRTAELAIQNAHQAATIDVLKVMSATTNDTQPVFDIILKRALELCDGVFGGLFEYDGALLHFRASSGFTPDALATVQARYPRPPEQDSRWLLDQAIFDKQLVYAPDMAARANASFSSEGRPYRSYLAVPLLRDDEVIGAIGLGHRDVGAFTEAHFALLRTFAEQAVIAIGSVATFRALQTRTAELAIQNAHQAATIDVLKVMSSTTNDTKPVFDIILRRALELCGAKFGGLFERKGDQVVISSTVGWDPTRLADYLRLYPRPLSRSWLMDVCMLDGRTVYIRDASIPTEIPGYERPAIPDPAQQAALQKLGFRSQIDVPLMRDGVGVGCIIVAHENPDGFTEAHSDLLKTFAEQAVIAIGSVATFRALQSRTAELSASLENLRATQNRLIQSEKLASLGQLTAGIAHEIKNPLNFVNNFADLSVELLHELTQAIAANDEAEIADLTAMITSNLEKIAHHGRRADSIVKNMLLHSRSGADEAREVELNALVEEALNLAYHGARAAHPGFNITLEKHLAPEAGRVELHPQEITRVLLNLFSNGFYAANQRATEPGFQPTLTLTTTGTPTTAEIRIRDNGTGIPDALREKIFEPFFTTKPAGEGTGLGLSLSHDIIAKQHAGTLSVDSEPNHHTEFTITLPRHLPQASQP